MADSKGLVRAVTVVSIASSLGCSAPDTSPSPTLGEPGESQQALDPAAAKYDWLQFGGDPQHSGNDARETTISTGNVATLAKVFEVSLGAVADGAPAYLSSVATSAGTKDLLFLVTKSGQLLARDAHTGAAVWSAQHGPGSCKINNGKSACFTTSSPAIDPARAHVYAYGLDGKVHQHAVADGTEVTTGGWPEVVTLKGFDEKSSTPVAVATAKSGRTYLYVGTGGYPGDRGDYQGHLTTIDVASGAQNVFNTLCSNQTIHLLEKPGTPDCASVRSAVWARSGVVYDAVTDRIYGVTGNGDYNGTTDWGDSVFAIQPDGVTSKGKPLDAYTPTNFQQLADDDADLGSTAPALLPVPTGSKVAHLAVQSGKDGKLRLLNLDDLSGKGGPGHTGGELQLLAVPQGSEVLTSIAVSVIGGVTWAFVANDKGISALKLSLDTSGNPTLAKAWANTASGDGGSSPIVAGGVLFYSTSGALRALAPTTGKQLWSGPLGSIHWESPMVANGVVYATDEAGNLTAFAPATAPSDVCATIAERKSQAVSCPAGKVFGQVVFASYGTPAGACGAFKTSACNATTSTGDVSSACAGKASCTLSATNAVFGDPCSGTTKHLDVELSCK
ncbi:MAG TPA: PQQ-binding-like beta-propeller repeat protein [Polyangiaceae bacterium]|jgi:hypothetical protein